MLKGQSPLTIQVIPNVQRIKREKVLVQEASNDPKSDNLPPMSDKAKKQLGEIDSHSYYRENIFSLEDMYLYRGVFKFYANDTKAAQSDFELSWKHHLTLKNQAKAEMK